MNEHVTLTVPALQAYVLVIRTALGGLTQMIRIISPSLPANKSLPAGRRRQTPAVRFRRSCPTSICAGGAIGAKTGGRAVSLPYTGYSRLRSSRRARR